MDGAARGKPGPVGIEGVLRDGKGVVLLMFFKNARVENSDEMKVLEAL